MRSVGKRTKSFLVFAKVNDRHFKVMRQRPKISSKWEEKEEYIEAESTSDGDFYDESVIVELEENDEIDANEAAFMKGYLDA